MSTVIMWEKTAILWHMHKADKCITLDSRRYEGHSISSRAVLLIKQKVNVLKQNY